MLIFHQFLKNHKGSSKVCILWWKYLNLSIIYQQENILFLRVDNSILWNKRDLLCNKTEHFHAKRVIYDRNLWTNKLKYRIEEAFDV